MPRLGRSQQQLLAFSVTFLHSAWQPWLPLVTHGLEAFSLLLSRQCSWLPCGCCICRHSSYMPFALSACYRLRLSFYLQVSPWPCLFVLLTKARATPFIF